MKYAHRREQFLRILVRARRCAPRVLTNGGILALCTA
jgi:hypothetical protein